MPKITKTLKTKKKTAVKAKARLTTAHQRAAVSKAKAAPKHKGLIHHGRRLYRATPKFIHGMVAGAVVGIIIVAQLSANHNAAALVIAAGKDCDSYSIINCGVTSSADLKNNYANSAYVRHVYQHFGISAAEIDSIGSTAVQGTVFRNGDVKVNGKVVATNSVTAARLRVTGGDKQVTVSGSTFYTRQLSSSWSHDSAQAYIVMKDGVFQFAILAPCGNPIIATPVKPTPPPPAPTPPTPQPTPSLVCDSLARNNDGLTYTFVARATAKNTTIKSYSFYLSDSSKPLVVRTSASQVSVRHKFLSFSTRYSAYVIVASNQLATHKTAVCAKDFTTASVTECKPGVPKGSAECTECDQNSTGDNACAPLTHPIVEAASVSTLANTGPGAILIVFACALVGGTLFHKTHHHIKKRRHAKRQLHHAH
jgi:hypothetical protein